MPRITEIWAYVIADSGPDDEGLISYWHPLMKAHMPMIGADRERVKSLKPMAELVARDAHKPVVLMRFTNREEMETIVPGEGNE